MNVRSISVCRIVLFYMHILLIHVFCGWTEDNNEKEIFIGIDLGTTYTRVGIYRNGKLEIIPNDQGNRKTPSCVGFRASGERLVGDRAKNYMIFNPTNVAADTKRLIGRRWNEDVVQEDIERYPYSIINENGKPHIQLDTSRGEKLFAPEEISAVLLMKMKEVAERYLGKKVRKAVVTVPAHFNSAQRQATIDAGSIVGLDIVRIINEPSAAALAYGFNKTRNIKNALVFNLGGGTFEVSLFSTDNGLLDVEATSGDVHLGGEDFTKRVVDHYIKMYKDEKRKNIRKDPSAVQKLYREVEKAKRALSSVRSVDLEIENFFEKKNFFQKLTREMFEQLNVDLFSSTMESVRQLLNDAKLTTKSVSEIILVGGSSRMPRIRALIMNYFHRVELNKDMNPDEAAVSGVAIYAGLLSGEEDLKHLMLLDVNPLSLGVETAKGNMLNIIQRNTVLSTQIEHTLSTVNDDQPTMGVMVYEGEHKTAKYNNFVASYSLTGIPFGRQGSPIIKVTFEFDVNGILRVRARNDIAISKTVLVHPSDSNNLTPDEIKNMTDDAEKFVDEEKKFKEWIDAKNDLESYVFSLKYQIRNKVKLGAKFSEGDKEKITEAVDASVKWLEKNPRADMKKFEEKKTELEGIVQPIITKLYEQSGGAPPPTDDSADSERDEL